MTLTFQTADPTKVASLSYEEQMRYALAASMQEAKATKPQRSTNGLFNLGNTCWFNALTQAIFKRGKVYRTLLEQKAKALIPEQLEGEERKVSLEYKSRAEAYLNIISLSEAPANDESNAKLIEALQNFRVMFSFEYPVFKSGQHDPCEAFLRLCDYLGLEVPTASQRSFAKSTDSDQFKYLAGEAPTTVMLKPKCSTLQESLDQHFMHKETMVEGEQILFDGQARQAYKVEFLDDSSIPKQLIFQVPRFQQEWIPAKKVLGLTLSEGYLKTSKYQEKIYLDPEITIPFYNHKGDQVSQVVKMRLVSVVGHMGTLGSGHYVSYYRNEDGSFTCFDDSDVSTLSEDEAKNRIADQSYMAVYEKVSTEAPSGDLETLSTLFEGLHFPQAIVPQATAVAAQTVEETTTSLALATLPLDASFLEPAKPLSFLVKEEAPTLSSEQVNQLFFELMS